MQILSLLAAAAAGCARRAPSLAVFAASSLEEVVAEVAREWTRRGGSAPRLQFGTSSTLARQIREGARASLILTADPTWLEGLGALERFDWLGNRLVLVAHPDAGPLDVARLPALVLAGEAVPVGKYARAALRARGAVLPPRIVEAENARDVLVKVEEGAAPAGIVYATDAAAAPGLRVAFAFPDDPGIAYAAALLGEEGRQLFRALREPWVAEIVRRRGFLVRG